MANSPVYDDAIFDPALFGGAGDLFDAGIFDAAVFDGEGQRATYDPANTSAGVSLSNGNLTVTGSASTGRTRSTILRGGKTFYSFTVATPQNGAVGLGIAALTSFAGEDTRSIGVYIANGAIGYNNVYTNTLEGGAILAGDVIDIAWDHDAELAWFRRNGGRWNTSDTANPATGAGGYAYNLDAASGVYPVAHLGGPSTSVVTANFGATAYTYAPPAGFLDFVGLAGSGAIGQAAGALPLTGSATGAVSVAGTATGALPLTGSATGAVSVAGTATGALPLTGSATGAVSVAGTATGALPLTGSATGTVISLVQGQASGALPLTGGSAAAVRVNGVASNVIPFTGTAFGVVRVAAVGAGNLPLTGAATGEGVIPAPALPGTDWAPPVDLAASAIIGQALRFMRLPPVARFDPEAEVLLALRDAFESALDECLEAADWSFASVLANLPAAALRPGEAADDDMPHPFQTPGDLIRLRRVIPACTRWRIDKDLLRADHPGPLAIRYTARITIEAALPATFQLAVSLHIAARLGQRWAGGVMSGDDIAGQALSALKQAMRDDARSAAALSAAPVRAMAANDLGYGSDADWGLEAVA